MRAKKIIITGGATRIGAAIAKSLVCYGVQITLHYNKSGKEVKKLKKELESYGSEVFLINATSSISPFIKHANCPRTRSTSIIHFL